MLHEQDQQVTIRVLPNGDAHNANFRELNGRLLSLELTSSSGIVNLKPGDLVEVICTKTLYLGEVRNRYDQTMVVGVEHSLDRDTLASIRQVWHGPEI